MSLVAFVTAFAPIELSVFGLRGGHLTLGGARDPRVASI